MRAADVLGGVLIAATVAGCATDNGTGTNGPSASAEEAATAGSYSLTQVNGSALPVSYPKNSKACISTIVSGTMTLAAAPNTFVVSVSVRSDCDTPIGQTPAPVLATLLENGTWTVSAGAFTPTRTDGSAVTIGAGTSSSGTMALPSQVTFSDVQTVTTTLTFKK